MSQVWCVRFGSSGYLIARPICRRESLEVRMEDAVAWSPDSRWVCIQDCRDVKTRPAGVLWELNLEEVLAKLDR